MINPLGKLEDTEPSTRFHLNKIDWLKLLRFLLIQVISYFVVVEVPHLTRLTYVWNGHDYTVNVVLTINLVAEALRRLLASTNESPQQAQAVLRFVDTEKK